MYQTVGQDGIHYIAEAMDLPLFRRTIDGAAVDQSSDYASTSAARLVGHVQGDETEDLFMLLQDVLVRSLVLDPAILALMRLRQHIPM